MSYTYKYCKEFSCLQKLNEKDDILDAMQMPEGDLLKIAELLKGTKDVRNEVEWEPSKH